MNWIKSQAANMLTILRIVLSLALLFLTALDFGFFIVYALCAMTDILDGAVARRLGTVSKLGALLDSIADIVFAAVYAIKLIPIFSSHLTKWMLYVLLATVAVKLISLIIGFVKFKKPCFLHTYLNKATGVTVFLLPFCLSIGFSMPLLTIACTVAFLAAVDELICIAKMKGYNADVKGSTAILRNG